MLLSVLSFFLGVLCLQQWSALPDFFTLITLLLFAIVLAFYNYWRTAFFLAGFLFVSVSAHYHLSRQLSADLQAKEILIQGDILGLPEYNERRVRFDFKVTQASVTLPDKLRLSWYYPPQKVTAGQSWKFFVKLKQPHGTLNPGGFDYEKWLFARHIGATGYIRKAEQAKLLATQSAWESISMLRQTLLDLLAQQTIRPASRAIIRALTLGDRGAISAQQWQVFSQTGTSHLMAISGLHIGLVAGIVYYLLFRIWLRVPANNYSAPQVAALCSFFAALLYAALAGFSIPTQRALIMLSVLMLATTLRRHIKVLNSIALAIFLVLLIDPFATLSLGFYLSFLAVFFILYVLSARLGRRNRFFSSIKIHAVVGLSLVPLLLFFFQSASIIAPIANLMAVPVVSFIVVPLSLLAVALLSVAPALAAVLLQLADLVIQVLWQMLLILAEWPNAYIVRPAPAFWQMLLAIFGAVLLLAPKGIPSRYLGVLFILPVFFADPIKPAVGEVNLTLLDVGQGLAVVVQTAEHSLVFDTGARFSESFDMGSNVVMPFLRFQRITALDKLIISHADNDHIGGAESILNTIPVTQVLSSVPQKLATYHALECTTGYRWTWDQVDFSILSPPARLFADENNNSCVLKIDARSGSALLTGDIEQHAEHYLVQNAPEFLKSAVLIAPHHGSKTSSSLAFLQSVQPDIVLIPADAPNRFAFPHTEVIARYQQIDAHYLITGRTGAIAVTFAQGRTEIEAYRQSHSHYWNGKLE